MPWRYLLAVTGSYLIFFALIRLWLLYVSIAGSGRSVPGAGFGDLGNLGGGAAFLVALATSLRGAARRVVGFGWTGSLLRSTWISFSIVLAMAGIFGGVAQHYCSKASKITEVLFACFLSF